VFAAKNAIFFNSSNMGLVQKLTACARNLITKKLTACARNLITKRREEASTWIWKSEGSGEILYGGLVSDLLSVVLQTHQALYEKTQSCYLGENTHTRTHIHFQIFT